MTYPAVFHNSRSLNCIGALSFSRSADIFRDFCSQIGEVILDTPKQEAEQKSEWLRREISSLKFYF